MEFELTESQDKLIAEVDKFLDSELNADVIAEAESCNGWGPAIRQFMRKLGEKRS